MTGELQPIAPAESAGAAGKLDLDLGLPRSLGQTIVENCSPLNAIGLWIVLVIAVQFVLGGRLSESLLEIVHYGLLGLLVPALLLIWSRADAHARPAVQSMIARMLVAVVLIAALIVAGATSLHAVVLVATIAQVLLLIGFGALGPTPGLPAVAALACTSFAGWSVAIFLLADVAREPGAMPLVPALVAGGVSLVLVCWWLCGLPALNRAPLLFRGALDLIAVLIIAAMAFRTDGLLNASRIAGGDVAFHHWGVFVGPADMVREGGWLLWDVPSQYGWLNILTIAAIPAASTWQAFYLFNACLVALATLIVYVLIRAVNDGLVSRLVALLTVVGMTYVDMGTAVFYQPYYLPSTGPIRYIWSYLLILVLLAETRTRAGGRAQRAWLVAGCFCWLAGVLWSIESAFIVTAVWIPAFLITVVRDRVRRVDGDGARRLQWRPVIGWGALPFLLLGIAVVYIVTFYLTRLGHAPDPRAYIDYALAFGSSDVASELSWPEGIDLASAILIPIVVFLAIMGVAAATLRDRGWSRYLGVMVAAAWMIWSWGSYVLSRKATGAMRWTLPAVCIGLAIVLIVLTRGNVKLPTRFSLAFRTVEIPIFVVIIAGFFGSTPMLANTVTQLRSVPWIGSDVTAGMPDIDPELAELLRTSGVKPSDPIAYAGDFSGNLMPAWTRDGARSTNYTAWIPAMPFTLLGVLPVERRDVYLQRMADRTNQGGWVIQRLDGNLVAPQRFSNTEPWFWDQVMRTHVPTQAYQSENWQLIWMERVDPAVPRPAFAGGRLLPLQQFVCSNGAGVWAIPGTGWHRGQGNDTPASFTSPAELWIYSPDPRQVTLRIDLPAAAVGPVLTVTGANNAPIPLASEGSRPPAAVVQLVAGWNRLVLNDNKDGSVGN